MHHYSVGHFTPLFWTDVMAQEGWQQHTRFVLSHQALSAIGLQQKGFIQWTERNSIVA
jgi:hypothetical protein